MTISSPASNSRVNTSKVSYTLSEAISAGEIVFTRTSGSSDGLSPHRYALGVSDRTAGSHTVNTGMTLVDGAIYTVGFENVADKAGNPTANISKTNVTYDYTAVAITNTSPTANSIITSTDIGYTLSEAAASGKITFTRTDGKSDPNSPHIYTLVGEELYAGAHTVTTGLPLVDGTFYTVSFDATDYAGNPSTTISNAMVYYDTAAPTGSISINSGAASTSTTTVTLTLTCIDAGVCSEMQFSNDNINWSTAETYAASRIWDLTSGNGTKTVYVKFKDSEENWSSAYSDTITLTQTLFEETDPALIYSGTWSAFTNAALSGGAMKYSGQTGAKAEFTFNGKGIKWIAAKANQLGKAKVYIDGVLQTTVDLYSLTAKAKQTVYQKTRLTSGSHTIRIEVTGQKNTGSKGYYVDIDAFEVVP